MFILSVSLTFHGHRFTGILQFSGFPFSPAALTAGSLPSAQWREGEGRGCWGMRTVTE
jgi:hypothetical protein